MYYFKEKEMKKRIIAVLIAIVAAFACLSLTACSEGNYSETFNGVASTESYSDENEAAAAFVSNEFNGETSSVQFVAYTKSNDLTEEEIETLTLSEEDKTDLVGVEVGRVSYTETSITGYAYRATNTELKYYKVYILRYTTSEGSAYKYYVPAVANGEVLSKSYFESVFNLDNYKNCTNTVNMVVAVTISQGMFRVTVDTTMSYTVKITEDGVYMVITTTEPVNSGSSITHVTSTRELYIMKTQTGYFGAERTDGGAWDTGSINLQSQFGVDELSELFGAQLADFVDHTYFEKTNTGFKLKGDRAQLYFDQATAEVEQFQQYINQYGLTYGVEASYFVTEGMLSKATAEVTLSGSIIESGVSANLFISSSIENLYSDFGTTSFELPTELQDRM